jgi:hypothetical protein
MARTLPHETQTKSSGPLPWNTGRSGRSWTAVPPSIGTSPAWIARIVLWATTTTLYIVASLDVKSWISASSTPETTPSPMEAALPLICAAVCTVPPPSASVNTTSALA